MTTAEYEARKVSMSRENRIAATIAACTECGQRDFPKHSDCDGCTALVDDEMAAEAAAPQAEADRLLAITREIATAS